MFYSVLIALITAYLLGNLNGAVCVSALIADDDVRKHGSGNAGLTNFIRSYGVGNAIFVILIDGGKAIVACLVAGLLLRPYYTDVAGMMLGGTAVMLGHIFPALLGFRGGKGILSGLLIALVCDWRVALIILAVFALVYACTKYVSLASILAAVAFGVGFALLHGGEPTVMRCGVFMAVLTIFMHRSNIVRLCKGEERKTNLFGKGSKQ